MNAHRIGARAAVAALLSLSGASLGAMPVHPVATSDSASAPATVVRTASALRGVYRVVLESEGRAPIAATIVVEQPYDQLEVSLLVDDRVSLLHSVQADGDVLRAKLPTSSGTATLTLRVGANGVAGTMTAKHRAWKVSGERSA